MPPRTGKLLKETLATQTRLCALQVRARKNYGKMYLSLLCQAIVGGYCLALGLGPASNSYLPLLCVFIGGVDTILEVGEGRGMVGIGVGYELLRGPLESGLVPRPPPWDETTWVEQWSGANPHLAPRHESSMQGHTICTSTRSALTEGITRLHNLALSAATR